MNKSLAIALLCISLQLVAATREDNVNYCLREKELDIETYEPLLKSIGEPDSAEKLKDAPKNKLAGVIACIFNKDHRQRKSINDVIKSLIHADDKLTEDQKKQMLDTLTDCNTKANEDNEKLLQCLKITDAPFAKIGSILLDVPERSSECFVKNGLKTDDIFLMKKLKRSLDEIIKHVDEDKLSCSIACVIEKERKLYPDTVGSFKDKISEIVEEAKMPADKKQSMRDTIQKCTTEAGEDECKFMKCIKLLRPPFSNLVFL